MTRIIRPRLRRISNGLVLSRARAHTHTHMHAACPHASMSRGVLSCICHICTYACMVCVCVRACVRVSVCLSVCLCVCSRACARVYAVISSPNSSYIWIKYMAYHLELTEIDKARQVSDRALKVFVYSCVRMRACVCACMHACANVRACVHVTLANYHTPGHSVDTGAGGRILCTMADNQLPGRAGKVQRLGGEAKPRKPLWHARDAHG